MSLPWFSLTFTIKEAKMSYVKEIAKIRDTLEKEVNSMLSRMSISNGVLPLHIKYRDTEMSYAVQETEGECHLILIDSLTKQPMYDVDVDCIDLEELAQVADALAQMEASKSA